MLLLAERHGAACHGDPPVLPAGGPTACSAPLGTASPPDDGMKAFLAAQGETRAGGSKPARGLQPGWWHCRQLCLGAARGEHWGWAALRVPSELQRKEERKCQSLR